VLRSTALRHFALELRARAPPRWLRAPVRMRVCKAPVLERRRGGIGEWAFVEVTLDQPTIDLRVRRLDRVADVHHVRATIGKAAADAQELTVLRGYQTHSFARLLMRVGLQDR